MKKLLALVVLLLCGVSLRAATDPLKLDIGGFSFLLPLQKVDAIQLYSFKEGRGFPGAETTLVSKGKLRLNFGAAPVLGTSENVPFVSLETRLSETFFDTSNNQLWFGLWVGQQSDQKKAIYGLAASIPLW